MAEDHAHHWRIEPPSGAPTVQGQCRHCGAVRSWPAADQTSVWTHKAGERPALYRRRRHDDERHDSVNPGYWTW